MQLSRRMFLGGAIATIGAASVSKIVNVVPAIYGNGVDDDWAGLDALWNGRPVRILTEGVLVGPAGEVHMQGGYFMLSRTLRVLGGPRLSIIGSCFNWTRPVDHCIFFGRGAIADIAQISIDNPATSLNMTAERLVIGGDCA